MSKQIQYLNVSKNLSNFQYLKQAWSFEARHRTHRQSHAWILIWESNECMPGILRQEWLLYLHLQTILIFETKKNKFSHSLLIHLTLPLVSKSLDFKKTYLNEKLKARKYLFWIQKLYWINKYILEKVAFLFSFKRFKS